MIFHSVRLKLSTPVQTEKKAEPQPKKSRVGKIIIGILVILILFGVIVWLAEMSLGTESASTGIKVDGFNKVNDTYKLEVYDEGKRIIEVEIKSPGTFVSGRFSTQVNIRVVASEDIKYDYISLAFMGANSPVDAGPLTLQIVPHYAEVLLSSEYHNEENIKGRMFLVNMESQPFYDTGTGEKLFSMAGVFLINPQQEKSSIHIGFGFGLTKGNSKVDEARIIEVPLASITTTSK